MIDVEIPLSPLHKELVRLKESDSRFYLTGSRAFGKHDEFSDFDFFVDGLETIDFEEFGYKKVQDNYVHRNSEWKEQGLLCVYRKEVDSIGIDIQVIHSGFIMAKFAVNELIKEFPVLADELYDRPKEERKEFWIKLIQIQHKDHFSVH